jgi:polysaccharide deacetylase family protein (PEP-CTERM system associated)
VIKLVMRNALTVDVEDYFHVSAFANHICPSQWDTFQSRVVANTRRLLRLFDAHQVRATFFVLGWVADRHPELVREIHAAGHEIACHSYWHRLVYDMEPDEFREDLRRARHVLEDLVGQPVTAFRAPSYSITRASLWALDVLAEEGFRYDSSIFPIRHDRYGMPEAPSHPHRRSQTAGVLWEFPPTVVRVLGTNVPVAGGGYFRLYPVRLSIAWLQQVNRRQGHPFVFYVHPWELDPDQPRMNGSLRSRFRHYLNLDRTEAKLTQLLPRFRWGTISQVLDQPDGARA